MKLEKKIAEQAKEIQSLRRTVIVMRKNLESALEGQTTLEAKLEYAINLLGALCNSKR